MYAIQHLNKFHFNDNVRWIYFVVLYETIFINTWNTKYNKYCFQYVMTYYLSTASLKTKYIECQWDWLFLRRFDGIWTFRRYMVGVSAEYRSPRSAHMCNRHTGSTTRAEYARNHSYTRLHALRHFIESAHVRYVWVDAALVIVDAFTDVWSCLAEWISSGEASVSFVGSAKVSCFWLQ